MNETNQIRQSELRDIVAKLPGKNNADRLRECARLLHCKPNTIRGWLLEVPHRHIPERQLSLLKDAVARTESVAA